MPNLYWFVSQLFIQGNETITRKKSTWIMGQMFLLKRPVLQYDWYLTMNILRKFTHKNMEETLNFHHQNDEHSKHLRFAYWQMIFTKEKETPTWNSSDQWFSCFNWVIVSQYIWSFVLKWSFDDVFHNDKYDLYFLCNFRNYMYYMPSQAIP